MENSGNKQTLRLWLRWLNCTTRIENEIRRRLREQFQVTLPQFDLLSALERTDEPMTMSELSQYLLVSNGIHGQEEAFGETLKNIRSDLDNLNQALAKEDS